MSRMVVMPVYTAAIELDGFDERTMDKQHRDDLYEVIEPVVRKEAGRRGASLVPRDAINACGEECLSLFIGLLRWGVISSLEIAGQMKGGKNYRRESIGDWQLGRDYTTLRRVTGADYALFIVIRDLRETTGRAVMNFLSGTYTYFKQVGVACVADLVGRRMVWCHAESDAWGDLRISSEARRAVKELLADLSP